MTKVIPVDVQPCLALWIPCCWEKGDKFPEEAEEFFCATGVVDNWKWLNGSNYPLRFQKKNGSICSVATQKWIVWNPNTQEFSEYSYHDYRAKFRRWEEQK